MRTQITENPKFYDNDDLNDIYDSLKKYMYINFGYVNDDDISDTIYKGIRYHKSYNPKKSSKKTWLTHILKNVILHRYKTNFYHNEIDDNISDKIIDNIEIEYDRTIYLNYILKEINNNPKHIYFVEYHINNLSYKDISSLYNVALYKVKNGIRRSRLKLRKEIKCLNY